MSDSKELTLGKAGEYLVCYDLLMNGHTAYLSDQGLCYDVVADINNKLVRIQVKSSKTLWCPNKKCPDYLIYSFSLLSGKRRNKFYTVNSLDYFAFVDLTNKYIAYLPIEALINSKGVVLPSIQFKSPLLAYKTLTGRYIDRYPITNYV